MKSFSEFFMEATGHMAYPYQCKLAEGDSLPQVMSIPTGAGKTAGVILGWLWRRRFASETSRVSIPRRLVYCLPMRVLVEQTVGEVRKWWGRLWEKWAEMADPPEIHILMGGDVDEDWILYPERDAILIGTQDMLLSRALNRGYAESRFRWPVTFGLLNNDALWVLDEVQLMGPGLATTAQLAAFRNVLGVTGPCSTLWMSATLRPEWLATVDFRASAGTLHALALDEVDRRDDRLRRRMEATKVLRRASKVPGWKEKGYATAVARLLQERHRPGSLSLVVVNTVDRAKQVFSALQGLYEKPKAGRRGRRSPAPTGASPELLLVHSRFRPPERAALTNHILSPLPPEGRIVVATQVVEAGVDISARLLVAELAPWASLVQRFGRCNRTGEESGAEVLWLDPTEGEIEDRLAVPYESDELLRAREILRSLEGRSLAPARLPPATEAPSMLHVLRRKDLVDLFDTTPEISGSDTDVSRFIRDADERDVHVFWRGWEGADRGLLPAEEFPAPHRDELCPAPISEVRDFLTEGRQAFAWDHLEDKWIRVPRNRLYPGMTLLLSNAAGGYSWDAGGESGLGWDPRSTAPVTVVSIAGTRPDATREDSQSEAGTWVGLAEHTNAVIQEIEAILTELDLDPSIRRALLLAARWHDAGKAHAVFQETLFAGAPPPKSDGQIWAKSPGRIGRHVRPHFRHEFASALALLSHSDILADIPEGWRDLAAYLVASHHGKVRLAARSLPGERPPADGSRFVLGIWEGDLLPRADLGGGVVMPATVLDLTPLEIGLGANGQPSWMDRMLRLRDRADVGPFRMAYLEAILRAADARASALPRGGALS